MVDETDLLEDTRLSQDLSIDHPLGRDEFLYDLIGINIMGLKSLGTLIKSPAIYFEAALSPNWEGKYWPSMRMWFGLMTIMIGLQFIWASESSEMTAMFRMLAGSLADGAIAGAERKGDVIDMSGSIIGLLTTFMMLPFKGQAYQVASIVAMALIFLSYCVTAYRGAYANSDTGTRIGMSIVIGLLIFIALFIAQFVSMMLALIPIGGEAVEMIRTQK